MGCGVFRVSGFVWLRVFSGVGRFGPGFSGVGFSGRCCLGGGACARADDGGGDRRRRCRRRGSSSARAELEKSAISTQNAHPPTGRPTGPTARASGVRTDREKNEEGPKRSPRQQRARGARKTKSRPPRAVTATATATQPSSRVAPHVHERAHQPNDKQPRPGAEAGAEAGSRSRPATESANNENTTTTRHPELRGPRPDPSNDPPLDLAAGSFHRVALKSAICSSVTRNNGAKSKEDARRSRI